ncbi:2-amino-4-hydroxy-6-hydroxymethyldihydropteridine diphosphokinase [Azoarcus sp. PA01]|nr:2-amino-4-hydroxy-6-hydroxymethyldihydropteridine diphosphokinase [Azoarcus sp. PA01]
MKRSGPGRTGATHAPTRAFVALGANLGEPVATLRTAFEALDSLPDTHVVARSSVYRTAPVGVSGQPDFFNAVAALDTRLPARLLLDALFDIEARLGRTRVYPQAPRTLDLDLLLYDDDTVAEPGLEIPHPRMHLRAFVLVPLAEIAPATMIPSRGRVADLLPAVRDQVVERLPG